MGTVKKIYEHLFETYHQLRGEPVWDAYEILLETSSSGGKILTCGNGGSASDAEHIVGELVKSFRRPRALSAEEISQFAGHEDMAARLQKGIPAIALSAHTSLLSAVGNDIGFDMVYAQQVYVFGQPGDTLIAMTTSGNSTNVYNAALTAKVRGMKVISITGATESRLSAVSDLCLRLPAEETYQIQEYTLPIYHALCAMLEETMFGQDE